MTIKEKRAALKRWIKVRDKYRFGTWYGPAKNFTIIRRIADEEILKLEQELRVTNPKVPEKAGVTK